MKPKLPSGDDIRSLSENDPIQILSFANQFFQSDEHPVDFRMQVALRLFRTLQPQYRQHLWEAMSIFLRSGAGADSRLYGEAKRSLSTTNIDSQESGSIHDFLDDLFTLTIPKSISNVCNWTTDSECALFAEIGLASRYGNAANFSQLLDKLNELICHDSFLIRKAVSSAVGNLVTRADLDDCLSAHEETIDTLLNRLLNDSHPIVRQSAMTSQYLWKTRNLPA